MDSNDDGHPDHLKELSGSSTRKVSGQKSRLSESLPNQRITEDEDASVVGCNLISSVLNVAGVVVLRFPTGKKTAVATRWTFH